MLQIWSKCQRWNFLRLRHLRHFLQFQVRLVFALFGGVGAVRFVVDPKTGQRIAYVELKNRENMAKARIHANG